MKNSILFLSLIAVTGSLSAQTVSSFLATDPLLGSLNILQVTDAVAGATGGGIASADTRTLFFRTADLNGGPGNLPSYTGPNWPYVFVSGSINISGGLDPALFGTIDVSGNSMLTVAGFPVYQFINHTAPGQFTGAGANWQLIGTDGTAYTQVPEPSTTIGAIALLALGMVCLRRRNRK